MGNIHSSLPHNVSVSLANFMYAFLVAQGLWKYTFNFRDADIFLIKQYLLLPSVEWPMPHKYHHFVSKK